MAAKHNAFFDKVTSTFTYVVYDGDGSAAAIIDPVLDYDHKSGRTRTVSNDAVIAFVHEHRLAVQWILETHAHADHLSGAALLKAALGGSSESASKSGRYKAHSSSYSTSNLSWRLMAPSSIIYSQTMKR